MKINKGLEISTVEEECVNLNEIPENASLDTSMTIFKNHKFKFLKDNYGIYRMIDVGISNVIQELWNNNYQTRFCCEGHKEDKFEGYISFKPEQREKKLVEDIIHNYLEESYVGVCITVSKPCIIRFGPKPGFYNTEYLGPLNNIILNSIKCLGV